MKRKIGLLLAGSVILAVFVACNFTPDALLATTDNEQAQSLVPEFVGEATLSLKGQVWTQNSWMELREGAVGWDWISAWSWEQFGGTRNVTELFLIDGGSFYDGWSGSITNGQLTLHLGTPSQLVPIERALNLIAQSLEYMYYDFMISDPDAKGTGFSSLMTRYLGDLSRSYMNVDYIFWETRAKRHNVGEGVVHVYVDREVTISASERVNRYGNEHVTRARINNAFDITLVRGWNALHVRHEHVVFRTKPGMFFDPLWGEETFTFTLSHGDPAHMKWVLFVPSD